MEENISSTAPVETPSASVETVEPSVVANSATVAESVSAPAETVTVEPDYEAIGKEWAQKNGYVPVTPSAPAAPVVTTPQVAPAYVSPYDRARQEAQELANAGHYVDTEWVYKRALEHQNVDTQNQFATLTARLEAPIMAQELTSKGFNVDSDTMAQAYQVARGMTSDPVAQKTLAQSLALGYTQLTKGAASASTTATKPIAKMPQADGGNPAGSGAGLTLTADQRMVANSLAKTFYNQPTASPEVIAKLKKEGFLD